MTQQLSIQALGVTVLCFLLIGLGVFVLARAHRAAINRLFALSMCTITGWIGSISLSLSANDPQSTVILGRLAFAFASAIPSSLLWMFMSFSPLQTRRRRGLILAGVCSILFTLFSFSPWIVAGSRASAARRSFIYGPLHPAFAVYFILCFGFALYTLWSQIRSASGVRRLQLRYLLLGMLIGGAGAITTNLLIPVVLKTSAYSLLGPYFSLVVASFSAHAIIRYRLMDIRVVIRQGVVYVCAVGVVAAIFVAFAVFLGSAAGYDTRNIPIVPAVAMALIMAIFFQPVKSAIQHWFNRYLYRQTYDYQRTIREASRRLSAILELESLLGHLAEIIEKTLKAETVCIHLRDDLKRAFTPRLLYSSTRSEPSVVRPLPFEGSALVAFLQNEQRILVRQEVALDVGSDRILAAAGELSALGGDIALPFFHEGALTGFLIVGPKLAGDPYFADDIDLLLTLVSQTAIAIKNAQLYHQVLLVNEYIENILSAIESGVIAVAEDGTITLFNAAAERMTGLAAASIRGKPFQTLPYSIVEALKGTLKDREPRSASESRIQAKAGHAIPIICSTSVLTDGAGSSRGAVAVFSDLTRLQQLESEKRRAERLASIGALASGIAHEIKNPLVAIKTFAELLPERFSEEDFRTDFAKVVTSEIERIDDLVARLRGLATSSNQRLRPIDIREPLHETLALLRGQLEQSNITVRTSLQHDLPLISGDPAQLKQLFLNLLVNAVEAMQPGGMLSVKARRRESLGGANVIVQVSDTGSGIPPHLLDKIFDPFVTTKQHGSGLGLSICRGIADAHRATIRVSNNRPGPGATIALEFPAQGATVPVSSKR